MLTCVFYWLYFTQFLALCTVFDFVSSNIDEDFSVNPFAVFVLRDFRIHHKDMLTYSGGTDRPGELCYHFIDLIPDCDSHSPALLDLFLSFDASICSAMVFPPLGNSDHVVDSVSTNFL